jgi:hypothetical protein
MKGVYNFFVPLSTMGPPMPEYEFFCNDCNKKFSKTRTVGPSKKRSRVRTATPRTSSIRMFMRVKLASRWLRLELNSDTKHWHKVGTLAEVASFKEPIAAAYKNAEQYLQPGK